MVVSLSKKIDSFGLAIAALLSLSACTSSNVANSTSEEVATIDSAAIAASATIEIDGSSTVYPITDAVVQAFQQEHPEADINLEFSGTTGGFRKFCAGETQISNASRPISTEELAACREAGVRFIELPIAFDALTVVVHPENDWTEDLTVEELSQIWESAAEGEVITWQQVRPSFPDRPITLYGPGTDSGTYDYFAEVVTGGEDTRSDYTASEDDTVLVEGVAGDPNALGYFGYVYYEQNQDELKVVAIDNGEGAILPSRETVEDATYQPLSRPLFIYVNLQASQENEALREFVTFYLENAIQLIETVGYIPLPIDAYEIGKVHFYQGEVGTAYEGKPQPDLTLQEVLLREQSF